jgi:hypothetical protein
VKLITSVSDQDKNVWSCTSTIPPPQVSEFILNLTIATARTKTPWNILGIDKVPALQFTMHKARDDLTNKKPAIYRVQQDNACFSVQHIVTEGFVLK